jgi:hypothetical protein
MEFGFIVLFIAIFVGCGRLCGWGARKYKEHHRQLDHEHDEQDARLTHLESRIKRLGDRTRPRHAMHRRGEEREEEPARMKRERSSPLEELQQRFVDGRLSLTEYEKELDRLERLE